MEANAPRADLSIDVVEPDAQHFRDPLGERQYPPQRDPRCALAVEGPGEDAVGDGDAHASAATIDSSTTSDSICDRAGAWG